MNKEKDQETILELVAALESAVEALDYAAKHLNNQTIHGHRVLRSIVNETRATLAKAKGEA